MSELYLIAHVVRGEPTFDIALRADDMGTETDPSPWWIIPTSGQRARPYWNVLLTDIDDRHELVFDADTREGYSPGFAPSDWPDHYPSSPVRPRLTDINLDDLEI